MTAGWESRRDAWIDRGLALLVLWHVLAGWTTALALPLMGADVPDYGGASRAVGMASERFGWFATELPSHLAGLWLPFVGLAALALYRRGARSWQMVAAGFYLVQVPAVFWPLHVCWWIGIHAVLPWHVTGRHAADAPLVAFNLAALALAFAHALRHAAGSARARAGAAWLGGRALALLGPLGARARTPTHAAMQFAICAMAVAVLYLPLFPPYYLYGNTALERIADAQSWHWRVLLVLPLTGALAFLAALAWARGDGRLGALRGALCAALAYVGMAMTVSVFGWFVSDEWIPYFRVAILAMLLLPLLWLVPAVGALAGAFIGLQRRTGDGLPTPARPRPRVVWWRTLTLLLPVALLLAAQLLPEQVRARRMRASAEDLAGELHAAFEARDMAVFHRALSPEAQALVDRDDFLHRLAELRDFVGEPAPRKGSDDSNRHRIRVAGRLHPDSGLVEFASVRGGTGAESTEKLVFKFEDGTAALHGVFMRADGLAPERNVYAPRRTCRPGAPSLLHCAPFDDEPPRPVF